MYILNLTLSWYPTSCVFRIWLFGELFAPIIFISFLNKTCKLSQTPSFKLRIRFRWYFFFRELIYSFNNVFCESMRPLKNIDINRCMRVLHLYRLINQTLLRYLLEDEMAELMDRISLAILFDNWLLRDDVSLQFRQYLHERFRNHWIR